MRRIIWWIGDNFLGLLVLFAVLGMIALAIMQIQYSTASCEELVTYRAIGDLPGRCLYLIQGGK